MNVLEAPPPRFVAGEVAEIAARLFGVEGSAVDLGSERDQTFLIDDGAGGGGVIKISNLGEDPAVLDLETEAILHVSRVDPALPAARPRRAWISPRPRIAWLEAERIRHRRDAAWEPALGQAESALGARSFAQRQGNFGATPLLGHLLEQAAVQRDLDLARRALRGRWAQPGL